MNSIPAPILTAMHRDDKEMQAIGGSYEDALAVYRKWTKTLLGGAQNHPDVAMGITHNVIQELPYCGALISIYQFNLAVSYVPDDVKSFIRGIPNNKLGECLERLDYCLSQCTINSVLADSLEDLQVAIVEGESNYSGFMRKVNSFIEENTVHLTRSWSKLQHKV